jgi:hypothetical protein
VSVVKAVDPARSWVVLVGSPTYADASLPAVPVIENNLKDLAEVLTDPELGGFDTEHCVVAPPDAGITQIGDLLVQAADEVARTRRTHRPEHH